MLISSDLMFKRNFKACLIIFQDYQMIPMVFEWCPKEILFPCDVFGNAWELRWF